MVNKTLGYHGPLLPHSAELTSATGSTHSISSTPSGLHVPNTDAKLAKSRMQTPLVSDQELEGYRDDAGLTKVVDRRWYEKNKHIFPASTWEDFDPHKEYTSGVRKDAQGNIFFSGR